MFKFIVTAPDRRRINLTLNTDMQTESVVIKFGGDRQSVTTLRELMDVGYGAFGHPINSDEATPEDVNAFLTDLKGYQFELVEGEMSSYQPAAPGEIY